MNKRGPDSRQEQGIGANKNISPVILELFRNAVIEAAGMDETECLAALGAELVTRLDDLYSVAATIAKQI